MRVGARDLRLVPPAVVAWLAAGLVVGVRDAPVALGIGSALLWVVSIAAALAGRSRLPAVALALAAAALVSTSVAASAGAREPPGMLEAAAGGRSLDLSVSVTGRPVEGRIPGTVEGVPVLVFGVPDDDVVAGAGIGDVITLRGSLQRTEPGDDVAFLVFARDPAQQLSRAAGLVGSATALRTEFSTLVARLPGPGAGLLPGLAIGDTSAVSSQLDSDMKTASLSHLTAVSGSNCAIVVGVVFALTALAGAPRRARIVVSAAALAGFVVLVTPEPSVLRAAAMAGIALGALALARPARGLPLLCVAVIALLAVDPWLARSYGFALSVLATLGLLCLAAPLARTFGRVVPRGVALLLAVPFAAQLACQPVLLMLDPSLPLYGVVANVLAEPAAPFATITGLAACLLTPVAPGIAAALAWAAWIPASWIAAVATFVAGLPGARSPWPMGPAGIVLLLVVTAAAILALTGEGPARMRLLARGALIVAVVAYGCAVAGGRLVVELGRPGDWEFAMCDVGQGDAVVIRSEGAVAVIDTGPRPESLAACLDQLGIGRIQLLVLTHYDLDHVGGVSAVLGRADEVIVGPTSDPGDEAIHRELAAAGARVRQVSRGERGALGALQWRVLWPPSTGVEPGNPASVTLLVRPGPGCACLSGVFLGDLGEESQTRLLAADPPGRVDVVKVAHHGSADQAPRLYESVQAAVGLIGVGADNDYGHPTPSLLDVLGAVGTSAYRTDLHGLVLVAPGAEPGEVRVWTERGVAPAA